ncbi:hypothetical protein CHS0354_020606 [Potamilus streckersoni]|uniref:Uncharacterized protein n=1 Tax=Potamilus streckersoni TaxID=2493646 RepID=A0AAE0RRY2_9BIVA|nr:hypothetical protein CHS0354_020606 [Potamilus streckersoni]
MYIRPIFERLSNCLEDILIFPKYLTNISNASKLFSGDMRNTDKISELIELLTPRNVKEFRQFHGYVGFYPRLSPSVKRYQDHKMEFLALKWAIANKLHDYRTSKNADVISRRPHVSADMAKAIRMAAEESVPLVGCAVAEIYLLSVEEVKPERLILPQWRSAQESNVALAKVVDLVLGGFCPKKEALCEEILNCRHI